MTELVREVAGVSLATQRHYVIKRKFWSFLEREFRVSTGDGQLIMFVKHPLLKRSRRSSRTTSRWASARREDA